MKIEIILIYEKKITNTNTGISISNINTLYIGSSKNENKSSVIQWVNQWNWIIDYIRIYTKD